MTSPMTMKQKWQWNKMPMKRNDNETKWQWRNDISNNNEIRTIPMAIKQNGNETKWQWNEMAMKQSDNKTKSQMK